MGLGCGDGGSSVEESILFQAGTCYHTSNFFSKVDLVICKQQSATMQYSSQVLYLDAVSLFAA